MQSIPVSNPLLRFNKKIQLIWGNFPYFFLLLKLATTDHKQKKKKLEPGEKFEFPL